MTDAPKFTKPVRIDMVSDVVCPWCFIGKHRLEKALSMLPDVPVEVHYRPYFLNDWIPREGLTRNEYLTTKFGSPERYNGIATRVAAAAAEEGLVYAVEKMKRQPNTIDCHRLVRWAEQVGLAAPMKQKLMDIYFTQGADLSDRDTLVQAAADVGLNADDVRAWLATEKDVETITGEAEAAKEAGIEGVPCFIFGGALAVSGAQAPEYLASAIQRVAEEQAKAGEAAE